MMEIGRTDASESSPRLSFPSFRLLSLPMRGNHFFFGHAACLLGSLPTLPVRPALGLATVWTFCFLPSCFSSGFAGRLQAQDAELTDRPLSFEADVRPILKTHCFHCHGEAGHREGALDLRLVHLMRRGGESGPGVEPGNAEESLIWQRVESGEMPPSGKSLSERERAVLKRWIDAGALTKRAEPAEPAIEEWTEEERSYWAFQPVRRPSVPVFTELDVDRDRIANPIDAFVVAQLQQQGLRLSPQADRATLLRRLSFDLLGLPPTPDEMQEFLADTRPDAYERWVDRMLADPRYGERWGRHWLDVAGYADSEGYTEHDLERPWAYAYRDYVLRAFNRDLPIDRFVVEQLAGDELVPQPWDHLQPEQIDALAATGFLRMAPDGTGQEGVEANVARNDVMADTIKIVSGAMLGMTVGCAQCHDHRYDPISQRDYYRMRAIFEPGLDWKQWRDRNARLVNLWSPAEREAAAQVDRALSELEGKRLAELDTIVQDIFDKEVQKLPEELREPAKLARATAADKRSEEQQKLMRDYPSLNVDRGSAILYDGARINEFNKKYEQLQAEVRANRPADRFLAAFFEVPNQTPTTHLFFRGDFQQPREPVAPGGLSILGEQASIPEDDTSRPTTGRRLAWAQHLTSGAHPLLARTLVNQIWTHHFGKGLVASPGDLGVLGERPTHPELLDWLASEMVDGGWSRKRLHRSILLSSTYQQASMRQGRSQDIDPENRWLSRRSIRRLDAESLRDAMLRVAGQLVLDMHGPATSVNPDEVGQIILGRATRDGNGILVAKPEEIRDVYRRTVYTQVRRSMPLGSLEPFDPPTLTPNCDRRAQTTVSTQSLLMMNHRAVIAASEQFARRVTREAGDEPAAQVRHAWRLALGYVPENLPLEDSVQWLMKMRRMLSKPQEGEPPMPEGLVAGTLEPAAASEQALALLCQAIYSSNAFLYVD